MTSKCGVIRFAPSSVTAAFLSSVAEWTVGVGKSWSRSACSEWLRASTLRQHSPLLAPIGGIGSRSLWLVSTPWDDLYSWGRRSPIDLDDRLAACVVFADIVAIAELDRGPDPGELRGKAPEELSHWTQAQEMRLEGVRSKAVQLRVFDVWRWSQPSRPTPEPSSPSHGRLGQTCVEEDANDRRSEINKSRFLRKVHSMR